MTFSDIKESIKNALDVVDIIGKSVKLTKQCQGEYTGATSSHSKSGASLKVDQKLQLWHDMSGRASPCGGDIFDWIAYENNLNIKNNFSEILKIAADLAGIQLEEISEEQKERIQKKQSIQDLLTVAAETYHKNLTPEIREYITKKWGINSETVDQLKIGYAKAEQGNCNLGKVATSEEWGETGLFNVVKAESGEHTRQAFEIFKGRVIFPYWHSGKVVNFAARGDFNAPINTPNNKFEKNGDSLIKYKKLLTHSDKHPYVATCVNNGYIFGEDTLKGNNYCVITEGIADAVVLLQNDYPVLSPVTTKFAKHDIEKLLAVAKRLKTVYICNDNEDSGAGEDGAIRTGLLLRSEGVDVRIMLLPKDDLDKIDVAEYFLKHTKNEFEEVKEESKDVLVHMLHKCPISTSNDKARAKTENMKTASNFIKEIISIYVNDTEEAAFFIRNELKSYFNEATKFSAEDLKLLMRTLKVTASKKEQAKETINEMIDPELDINEEFKELYTVTTNSSGKIIILPHIDEIAARVIENKHVVMCNDNIFCYSNNFYSNNPYDVKAEIARIVNGICKGSRSNGNKKRMEEVLNTVKNTNPQHEYPFNRHNTAIPCRNGVIVFNFDKNEISIENHNAEKWKFNYCLPVEYNANEKSTIILNELKKYTVDYEALIQCIAQALLQMMGYGPYKKAYLLKGKKNCGKTTFLDIVEKVIGDKNKSKVALNELTPQSRFSRAELEGKLMNLDDDLGYFKMSETGVFKKLTGGYSQKIEKKGLDAYDVHITCVHVFTTNTPAGFDKRIFMDDAFWERWEYIEFDHTFEKDDEFKQKILTEANITGFFNNILDMLIEIRKNKQLKHEQEWVEVRNKWIQESNVLFRFIEDNMVAGGRTAFVKENLLAVLRRYCLDEKIDSKLVPEDEIALGSLVEVCGGTRDDRRDFPDKEGKIERKHCFVLNYAWKPNSAYINYAIEEHKKVYGMKEVEKYTKNAQLNSSVRVENSTTGTIIREKFESTAEAR